MSLCNMSLSLIRVYACATVSKCRAWVSEQDEKNVGLGSERPVNERQPEGITGIQESNVL